MALRGRILALSIPLSFALVAVWIAAVHPVQAAGCVVPSITHTTIQAAIDDTNCTIVELQIQTYEETVQIQRDLTLIGGGVNQTIITSIGNHQPGQQRGAETLISIFPGSTVTITSMTLTESDQAFIVSHSTVLISDIWMVLNGSTVDPFDGTAIYAVGANNRLTVVNSVIMSNTSIGFGGGIYSDGSFITVTNSLVADNQATLGGGFWLENTELTIANSIVSDNS